MKNIFSKLGALVMTVIILCTLFAVSASAATHSTLIDIGGITTANIGSTVTAKVTIKVNNVGSVTGKIKYDNKILEYTGTDADSATSPSSAAGIVTYTKAPGGKDNPVIKFTFKVKAVGQTTIEVLKLDECLNYEYSEIDVDGTQATFTAVDASTTKSSNANLTHITPSSGTLTPKFSADVTTYSLTVPNSVTTVTLGAATAHKEASWDVEGSKEMKVGSNKRVIVVTAEDGTTKKYTINITRLAADGTTPEPETPDTENPTDSRVSVTADGKDMYIADSFDTENLPEGYTVDVYDYNGKEVPCIKKGNAVLLFLTSLDGQNGGFFRVLEDGSFTAFVGFNSQSLFYEALKPDKIPDGYSEIELDIGGVKVTAYQSNDPSLTEFVLIYAKGPGGYTGFYRYDTTEHTLQRAVGLTLEYSEEKTDNSVMDNINGLDLPTKVVAITIIAIMALLIAAIIVLIVKIARSGKYDEEEEYEEIEEDDDDTSDFEFVSISDRDSNEE